MTSIKTGRDRRQYKRYDVDSGGFALIQSDDTEVLGSINNISAGGFSMSHMDGCEEIAELSTIAINLISDKHCAEKFNGINIWSNREEGCFESSRVKMRCCGIAFEQLNDEMRDQIDGFIGSLNLK